MTPLLTWLVRRLPPRLAQVALALIYALLMCGIVLTLGSNPPNIQYLDIPEAATDW